MAYVKDTLSWTADEADFRLYSGIAAGDANRDRRLEQWFNSALYEADYYMENEFVDADGVDVPHPPEIRTGVYEYVIACDTSKNSGGGGSGTVKSKKTGQLQETYATGVGGRMSVTAEIALRAAAPWWRRNKIDLLISGTI